MRVNFLLFFVAWIIFFPPASHAAGGSMFQGTAASETANAWKAETEGRMEAFWSDLSGDGRPDIYFAMHLDRYRQVQVDENSDGAADLILLLDQDKGYLAFSDADGDGFWQKQTKWKFASGKATSSKARRTLLAAVEQRIFLDEHPDRWEPFAGPALQSGFELPVAFQSYRVILRLTKMPASLVNDPNRSQKPLTLPEMRLVVTPGQETIHTVKSMRLSDDLLFEGRPAILGSLDLALFALPYTEAGPGEAVIHGAMLQVSGRLTLRDEGSYDFCSLIPLLQGSTFSSTVPLLAPSGSETGSLFIELFLTDKRAP